MKVLVIAGHGKRKDGTFDTGARGLVGKGENLYFTENFFPAMKKYLPKGADIVFHTEYNVYDYGNLKQLVQKHKADTVIEFHLDSFSQSARGGHVIVWHEFVPDSLDRRLRDAIGKNTNLRLEHLGEKGIHGRNDLQNARMSARDGIEYRLLESANVQNKQDFDVLIHGIEKYAKDIVEAIFGKTTESKPTVKKESKPAPKKEVKRKTIDEMADEVNRGVHGNGEVNRRHSLGVTKEVYDKVQQRVNEKYYGVKPKAQGTSEKEIDELARRTYRGEFGIGAGRKELLGELYDRVQKRVNEIYYS